MVDFTSSKQRHIGISNLLCLEWCKPPGKYIKINSEASWDPEDKHAGIGAIARDGHGDVLSVKGSSRSNINSIVKAMCYMRPFLCRTATDGHMLSLKQIIGSWCNV
ncbi:unnamed protein product [Rhodiola kirilowii]